MALQDGRHDCTFPAIAGRTIHFVSDNTHLYALDTGTYQPRWRFRMRQRVYSSPATDGGLVYAGSGDQYLYALDAQSGATVVAARGWQGVVVPGGRWWQGAFRQR